MGKPYSIDLRERVQGAVEGGQSRRGAARHYEVSASFAVKLADRVSRTGSAEPARQGHIADRYGSLFRRRLWSAERLSERAMRCGSFHVNTLRSRSSALLCAVT